MGVLIHSSGPGSRTSLVYSLIYIIQLISPDRICSYFWHCINRLLQISWPQTASDGRLDKSQQLLLLGSIGENIIISTDGG